ncbi:MAG: TrkA family potassium uptake protein, partial [Clostridia bacterium]|nr:TrkA family potassium uptake protein [Clostridia bacterium]
MKSILLIGMGKFGQLLGKQLLKLKNEVVIVDKNEEIINRLASSYASAKIMNALNTESLQMMDIPSYDSCVVAIGDDFQSSLEVTSLLKELGAKHVVSRATTQIQRKFLLRNGADEVIYPDLDIAEKVAITLTEHVHDYIEIDPKYSVME